mmetsp:Transcript_22652/g.67036  ORF Transcript_22652/g.67036 Transcript_22652/m.67036 type:complete len:212 (+) Transcript_22652:1284-1919(+)
MSERHSVHLGHDDRRGQRSALIQLHRPGEQIHQLGRNITVPMQLSPHDAQWSRLGDVHIIQRSHGIERSRCHSALDRRVVHPHPVRSPHVSPPSQFPRRIDHAIHRPRIDVRVGVRFPEDQFVVRYIEFRQGVERDAADRRDDRPRVSAQPFRFAGGPNDDGVSRRLEPPHEFDVHVDRSDGGIISRTRGRSDEGAVEIERESHSFSSSAP